jgi:hypothetical protein
LWKLKKGVMVVRNWGAEMKGKILNKWLTAGKCNNEEYEKVTEPE